MVGFNIQNTGYDVPEFIRRWNGYIGYRCIVIDRVIPESGCAFGCLRQNRSCRPGTPAQRKERALAFSWEFLVPACRRLELPSRSRVRSGVWEGYLRFRSVWCGFWCLRKSVAGACHPVIAISVVPKLGTTQAVWMPGL
jgi:hypothetical protein